MPKPIARRPPPHIGELFRYITGTDFGRKIWPWDRSFFSLNSPDLRPDFGGLARNAPNLYPGSGIRPGHLPLFTADRGWETRG